MKLQKLKDEEARRLAEEEAKAQAKAQAEAEAKAKAEAEAEAEAKAEAAVAAARVGEEGWARSTAWLARTQALAQPAAPERAAPVR